MGIDMFDMIVGVIVLVLNLGVYVFEIIRVGIDVVDKG